MNEADQLSEVSVALDQFDGHADGSASHLILPESS